MSRSPRHDERNGHRGGIEEEEQVWHLQLCPQVCLETACHGRWRAIGCELVCAAAGKRLAASCADV